MRRHRGRAAVPVREATRVAIADVASSSDDGEMGSDSEPEWLPADELRRRGLRVPTDAYAADDEEDDDDDVFHTLVPSPIVTGRSTVPAAPAAARGPSPLSLAPPSLAPPSLALPSSHGAKAKEKAPKKKKQPQKPRKKRPMSEAAKARLAERQRERAAAKAATGMKSLCKLMVSRLKVTSQAWDVLEHLSSTEEEPDGSDGSVQSYLVTDDEDCYSYKSQHMRRRYPSLTRKFKPAELLESGMLDGLERPSVQVLRSEVASLIRHRPCEILTCTVLPDERCVEHGGSAEFEPRTLVLPCRHVIHSRHLLEPFASLWRDPADTATRDPAAVSCLPDACWVCGTAVQDILAIVYVQGKPVAASVNDTNLHMSVFTGQSLHGYLKSVWEAKKKKKKTVPPKKKKRG